jgi:hypothetical protein
LSAIAPGDGRVPPAPFFAFRLPQSHGKVESMDENSDFPTSVLRVHLLFALFFVI